MTYIAFVRDNPRWLAGGFLLTFFSTFGMTSFVALSAGDIRRDYGLSHGEFGTLYMFATLTSALSLPYLGQIVDRHSVRNVALFIVPMLALASASMALSQHLVMLFVAIYLLRLFGQGMMVHAAYTATARWFSAQRGRALSTVILGHNAGDAFLPMGFVLISAAVGWRNGWLLSAAVLALVAVPAVAFLVATDRKPRSSDPVARRVDARDWTRAEVVRDPIFYVLLLGVMAPGLIVTTLFFHQVYLVELRGWSLEVFASSYLVTAVVNTAFTLVVGQLIDRFSGVSLLPFVLLPLGFACLFLGLVDAQWSAFGFMALLGVSNGLSTTLFGAVWPEVYGLKHLGSIRALIVAAGVLASAIGPGLTGFLIDGGVSYPGQILAMGFYCFAVSFVLLLASRRVRARSHVQAAPAAASV
ncbi:MFS family permease [Aminobacter niigataensis]|uniref:MFS family permease n=1 Tax=Aminobacter niigataensis TaxID=83265 RepID=A0ABR6KX04_9HYPH|nr:MFS family permease [Aminobacter niigataensis]